MLARYEPCPFLGEWSRRLWAANEAIGFGKGGIRAVAEVLEISPVTIIAGTEELKDPGYPLLYSQSDLYIVSDLRLHLSR